MKVVILCGGRGTRLYEETEFRPKPLVTVGDRPILGHIMEIFGRQGFDEFVLCLGYKGDMIKSFFLNFHNMTADFSVDLKTGAVDLSVKDKGLMQFSFNAEVLPGVCYLVLERPEDFEIKVNGQVVSEVCGWWVDEDIKRIDISEILVSGVNSVELSFDYRVDMELEDLYLVGDFGVSKIDQNKSLCYDNLKLVELPEKLS